MYNFRIFIMYLINSGKIDVTFDDILIKWCFDTIEQSMGKRQRKY